MNLIAILAALGLEQWRSLHWRTTVERAFVRYARRLEHRFNGGRAEQGMLALAAALLPPVLLASGVFWAARSLHPLLGLAWNIAVLVALIGFRRLAEMLTTLGAALQEHDLTAARRALGSWRGGYTAELSSQDVASLAIERGLVDAYRQMFAVLFWFAVLPGPAAAVLYRATILLAREWRGSASGDDETPIARSRAAFGAPARKLLWLLDLVPTRLTALSFAVVGDFEDAAWCWRTQAQAWWRQEGGLELGVVLASGAGALGVRIGGPILVPGADPLLRPELGLGERPEPEALASTIGLVWRALILWLLVVLLVTLANLAPR